MENTGSSNWRPPPPQGDQSVGSSLDSVGPNNEWRSQLPAEARQRIISKIMDTLKKHLPISAPEGLGELNKIAVRFEEKIFAAAESQNDYLRRISMKMLTMEQKNPGAPAPNPGSASLNMASQSSMDLGTLAMRGQGASNVINPPSVVVGQNPLNNPVGVGQGPAANLYANSQVQMHVRQLQQPISSQQQQQQSQNQIVYPQQLLKQKVAHPLMPHSVSPQSKSQPLLSNTVQQGVGSIYQQSQPRALQATQPPALQQQASSILQQSSQNSMLLGSQSNMSTVPQRHFSQQNIISDMQQQQRLPTQQNDLLAMQQSQQALNQQTVPTHQQQLTVQGNLSGLQQQLPQQSSQQNPQHQSQLLGSQSNAANVQQHPPQAHMLQHTVNPGQVAQASGALSQLPGQQASQQQQQQQQQHQSVQMQQQMSMQPQVNSLQRHHISSAILPPQNVFDQQKQQLQNLRVVTDAPTTSLDSSQVAQAGTDAHDEIYEKVKSLKDTYFSELHEVHQKITSKLQQYEGMVIPPKQSDQLETWKRYKGLIERLMQVLQMPKRMIGLKDRLPAYERQIHALVGLNRKMIPQTLGQQFQHPGGISQSITQQSPQSNQLQQSDILMNQVQPMNIQTSVASAQATGISSMQGASMSSAASLGGAHSTSQNMMNSLQTSSIMDSSQENMLSSLPQGAIGLQQNNMGTLNQSSISVHQNSMNALMQNAVNPIQANGGLLQQNCNAMQHQQMKQDQQKHQSQVQINKQQFHQRQFHQQVIQQKQFIQHQQKQQMLQQQPQLQQQLLQQKQLLQQGSQVQPHQIQQLHQMNEMIGGRNSGAKSGIFQSHSQVGQRQAYYQHQFNSSSPFSPQAPSPLMSQHSSPQVDQQTLPSHHKGGTPVQSATPPFVIPSPSTPLAPSPLPGDHDKQPLGFPSLSSAGTAGQPGQAQIQSLAVNTPGISASPLLAELDGFQSNVSAVTPGKFSSEQPIERLIKAVKSSNSLALHSSIKDISSVVSMIDRIAGAAPGNGSRAAVGEDLVAMTKCRLQARNFVSQDVGGNTRKMKRLITAMPMNAVPYSSGADESIDPSPIDDTSEVEPPETSGSKRPKLEENNALLKEIMDINQKLIDTTVDVIDNDMDSAAEGGEGTVVKFTFCAVALSPNLKSHISPVDVSPISPLRLLVPKKYPSCSPIVLDKLPMELRGTEDLSAKARSRFGTSIRCLPQAMSLMELARTWDISAREVILEYAKQYGGGSFSSRYCNWENFLGAQV